MARKDKKPKANPQSARRKILAAAGVEATDELMKMPWADFTAKFGEPEKKPRRAKAGSRKSSTPKNPTTPKVVTVSPPDAPKEGGTGKPKTRRKAKAKTVTVSTVMSGGTSTKTGLPTISSPTRKTTIGLSIPEPTPAGGFNPQGKPKTSPPPPPPPPNAPKPKRPNLFAGGRGSQVAAVTAQAAEAESYVEKNIKQEAQAARSFLSGIRKRVRQIGKPKAKVTTGQPTKAGPQMTRARITKAGPQGTNVRIGPTRGPGYRGAPRASYPMPTVGGKTYLYYPPSMRTPEAKPTIGRGPLQKAINSGPASGAPWSTLDRPSIASEIAVGKKTAGRELASVGTSRNPAIRPLYAAGQTRGARPIKIQSYYELPGLHSGGRSVTGNRIRRSGYAQMTPSTPPPRIGIPKSHALFKSLPWTRQFSAAGGGMGVGVTMTGSAPMGAPPGTTSPPPTSRRRKKNKPTPLGRPVNPARSTKKTVTTTRPAAPPSAVPSSSYSTPTPPKPEPKAIPGTIAQSDAGTRIVRTGKREVSVYLPGQENRPALVTATSNKKSPSKTRLPTSQIDFEGFAKSLISDLEGPITEKDTRRPTKKGQLKVADNVTRMEGAFPTPQARAKHRARLLAIGRSANLPKTAGGKHNWTNTLKKKGFLGLAGGAVVTGLGVAADVLMNPDQASAPPMPAQKRAYEKQQREKYKRARAAGRKAFPAFRMYN